MISDRVWPRRFHSDAGIIGSAITVSEEIFTIAGVMPREFESPASDVDLWIPLRVTPATKMCFQVVARMRPGITLAQASSNYGAAALVLVIGSAASVQLSPDGVATAAVTAIFNFLALLSNDFSAGGAERPMRRV